MAVLTSVLAIALLRLQLALGHAFLSYPIGRNFYHRIALGPTYKTPAKTKDGNSVLQPSFLKLLPRCETNVLVRGCGCSEAVGTWDVPLRRIQGDMYNIAGFDAGGPSALNMANGGVWPGHAFPETHGLCGNNVLNGETMLEESLMAPVPIQATFLEGDIVEFEVAVTAHHKGYYEIRICDQ
eukprot:5165541-Amphidinium_carterae.2